MRIHHDRFSYITARLHTACNRFFISKKLKLFAFVGKFNAGFFFEFVDFDALRVLHDLLNKHDDSSATEKCDRENFPGKNYREMEW